MALYVYICHDCDSEVEEIRTLDSRDQPSLHEGCGGLLEREEYPGCNFNATYFVELSETKDSMR